MRSLAEVADQELVWIQPRARRRAYALRAGEESVASLTWPSGGGAQSVAEAGERCWIFTCSGLWRPRLTVRAVGADADLAVFHARWTGSGVLEVLPGRRFRWDAADRRRSRWTWRAEDGRALVTLGGRQGMTRLDGRVDISPPAVGEPELALLVSFGWYLVLLRARDSVNAAAAVPAAINGSV